MSPDDQRRVASILRTAHDDVKKYYYDESLHGVDWEGGYARYQALIPKVRNLGEGFRIVAAYVGELKDSHTYFVPPERDLRVDPGYVLGIVGSDCFVTQIRPGSDAATKLHIGDRVLKLDGFAANRQDFVDLTYYFETLAPQLATKLDVRTPAGEERELLVKADTRQGKRDIDPSDHMEEVRRQQSREHAFRSRIVESGDVTVWKLHHFNLDREHVEGEFGKVRKHKTLILDLRNNGGGAVDTLLWIVGSLFDHDVKVSDRVERKSTKETVAKRMGGHFDGQLIVVVDAGSASAAEILARVVQLEHRGTVVGDKTSGMVMETKFYRELISSTSDTAFELAVTDANLVMSDGKSLEKTGVTPDVIVLPTAADLAAGRDPVLARAAELAGLKISPEDAGKMFPYEWPPI